MTIAMNGISNGAVSMRDDSKYLAHNIIMKFAVSMALKTVLKLGIPDILATAEGKKPLSAAEILSRLPTKSPPGPNSSTNLRRLLSPLVREGVFSESFNDDKQPLYGLTEISKWFIRDSEFSMTPVADLQLHTVLLAGCWDRLYELILDETAVPFIKAQGIPFWEYCNTEDLEFGAKFQAAMASYTRVHRGLVVADLCKCGALDGVNTMVDVGGGWGAVVAEVVAHIPHIRGINFDLPNVIDTATAINGVQHVPGSFFDDNLPSGDVLFLKSIVHDHGDQDALKILQSCFNSLPKNGKVIIAEYILNKQDDRPLDTFKIFKDLVMMAKFNGARERTEEEYQLLLATVGFKSSKIIWNPSSYDFIIGTKE